MSAPARTASSVLWRRDVRFLLHERLRVKEVAPALSAFWF
jgi:hypothetical protein